MNYRRFTELLRSRYAESELDTASQHGGFANARTKTAVSIVFQPGGKVYDYAGSYTDILEQLGIMREWVLLRNGEPEQWYYTEMEANSQVEIRQAQADKFRASNLERGWYDYGPKVYSVEHRPT